MDAKEIKHRSHSDMVLRSNRLTHSGPSPFVTATAVILCADQCILEVTNEVIHVGEGVVEGYWSDADDIRLSLVDDDAATL